MIFDYQIKVKQKPSLRKYLTGLFVFLCFLLGTTNVWAIKIKYPDRPACPKNEDNNDKRKRCKYSITRGGTELFALTPSNIHIFTDYPTEYQGQLTYQAHPTFWFYTYIRSNQNESPAFKVTVRDTATNQIVYETIFNLKKGKTQYGIFSFQLPDDAPELEVNKTYYWQVSALNNIGESIYVGSYVEGYIQRKSLPSEFNNDLSVEEKLEFYAQRGIWHDLITELAQLRQQNPNDEKIQQEWFELLEDEDVKLEDYKNQEFIDCCLF